MDYISDNNILLMLNFLNLITILWVCKKMSTDTCNNLDRSSGNYAEWKKAISKVIYYIIPFTEYSQNDKIIEMENRLLVTRG